MWSDLAHVVQSRNSQGVLVSCSPAEECWCPVPPPAGGAGRRRRLADGGGGVEPPKAQPKDQGPNPLSLSKPSRSCQSGADRAKYTHSQYCGVRAGLEEGSILLSLEK
ncbi:unnamed protein product [Rangifer tarandus platyrhynchus]|uniref:Uncharacterized protein n=1 Tax=Rangifer tarandus platyrhynchus TaxID=3082113 RepID=A0ABN8ZBD3_RANTA|nr:unnamed protein product [Rangifer tarandus platyrhynchus]